MAANDDPGKVHGPKKVPPTSSLVDAFSDADTGPADAIVLRGYLGRSDILRRAQRYLERAKTTDEGSADALDKLIAALEGIAEEAEPQIPYRLYLTPSLDRYVDFHESALLAWRQEPKVERRDTVTVWLRAFASEGKPLPYRVVQETMLGPSFSAYLGGDLVDDYLGQSGPSGTAWGDQSGVFGGGRPKTGVFCGGKPRTGIFCSE